MPQPLILMLQSMTFAMRYKKLNVDVGPGILAMLAWLACFFGCSMVGELLGMRHCVLRLHNV